jgi:hypothetical protein
MDIKTTLFTILFCIVSSSCATQKINYAALLEAESIYTEDGRTSGFLKKDITVQTPYGEMEAAALGWESGHFFDFSYYKNGNLNIIWLRNEITILYDTMSLTLKTFEPGKVTNVVFFDNFNIKTCKTKNEVTYLDTKIPANTCFHFNRDGTLQNFVIYQDWIFENIFYPDGQGFFVMDKKIVPDRNNLVPGWREM